MHVVLYIETKLLQVDIMIIHWYPLAIEIIYSRVFYEQNKYSTHAEKNALFQIKDKNILRMCKIYIIKIRNNEITQSIPCDACAKLLKKYGVKKIYTDLN